MLRFKKTKVRHAPQVLYVADGVSSSSTVGDKVHVVEFSEVLAKKGFNITLLIRNSRGTKDLNSKNLVLFGLPDWNFPWSLISYVFSFLSIIILCPVRKPAFIYVRDTGINLGVIAGRLFGVPTFLEINGNLLTEYADVNRTFLSFLMSITYSKASAVVIPSRNQLSIFGSLKMGLKKIFVISNGVNTEDFRPLDKSLCQTKLGLESSLTYFCFVGHLTRWQGIDKGILAFSRFLRENRDLNIRLLIAGDGALREELGKLTSDLSLEKYVLFLGSVPHNLVPCLVNACDVCIAPFTAWRNQQIGLSPLKLYEYLSCGKPVIASAVPGTELIEAMDAGILVEPDNIEDFKNAYKQAVRKIEYWKKKTELLHIEMANHYSWDKTVSSFLELTEAASNAETK